MSRSAVLGLDILFRAYVDAKQCEDAVPELRDYYNLKLRLLSQMMTRGIQVTTSSTWEGKDQGREWTSVARLAASTINCAAQYLNPFPIYLEGGPPAAALTLRERYNENLVQQGRELFAVYEALFIDAIRFLFPESEKTAITHGDLVKGGLPEEEPDPNDFM